MSSIYETYRFVFDLLFPGGRGFLFDLSAECGLPRIMDACRDPGRTSSWCSEHSTVLNWF